MNEKVKTKMYLNLPHLQITKQIVKHTMKFPDTSDGYATAYSIYNTSINY